jgi:glucose uptake protein GlcU
MKNTIIKYGFISGAIAAGLQLIITLIFKSYGFEKVGFENSAYFGYTLIILSMAVIFFGIKAHRDKENEGKVSFQKGLMIGLSIMLISCVCYIVDVVVYLLSIYAQFHARLWYLLYGKNQIKRCK